MSRKRQPAPPRPGPVVPGRGRVLAEAESSELRRAKALWAKGDFDAALHAFEAAVRLDPFNVRAMVDAARAFGFRYQLDRAEQYTRRLLDLGPDDARIHHFAGETYRMLTRFAEATACFERALALAAAPDTQLELAALYERGHRVEEAYELVRRALAGEPRRPQTWLVKARCERRLKHADRAEASLRHLIGLAANDPNLAAEAWAELGQLYDARGDYDAAWEAVGRGKQLLRAREAPERQAAEHVLQRFARMVDALTPEHFARWHDAGQRFPPRRLALLTGFPRSGTTLLEQVLDSHPGLVSSEEKDVLSREVFPALGTGRPPDCPVEELLDGLTDEGIGRQRAYYFACMEGMLGEPVGDRVHLDKNPAMNLMIPVVLRLFPEARLLIALRDPRDVVLSCYLRHLPLNPVSVSFLTPERTAQRYALDLLAWLKFRDLVRAPWREVRYEDSVADLPVVARQALTLLGLPWDERVLAYRERLRQKPVLSPTYEAVTRPVYTTAVGRWRNYAKHLEPVLPVLEPYVREFGYG